MPRWRRPCLSALGSVSIAPGKVAEILMGGGSGAERNILTQIRLPRMCMTVLLGGALAVSGYLLQTFFGNPIAGPYVLGISSGAKLAVCAALLFVAGGERQSSGLLMILAAFAGALVTTGAIVLLSHRRPARSSCSRTECGTWPLFWRRASWWDTYAMP